MDLPPSDVHIRPIAPGDGPRLTAFHGALSAESIRNRFFAVHPQLSAAEVAHFTHVDGRDRAPELGVTHFVADTLFSNTAMLGVLRRPNGSCERYEDGVVHVRFPIEQVPSAPGLRTFASCAPAGQSVRST